MPEAAAQQWAVPMALDGERVDRALALITGLSRREINAVLDEGRVTLGRRVVTSHSRKVHAGEHLAVVGDMAAPGAGPLEADPSVDVPVVFADRAVIVVDKPAGLVVHPGHGNLEGTMVQGLLSRYPDLAELSDDAPERPGIVHRLDKGTSGLLVVARTAAARDDLAAQLAHRSVQREYLALVLGHLESEAGLIDAPLGRSDIEPGRIRVQAGGRAARTRYTVEARFEAPAATSLVRCRLETGRTHQIRVHLSTIGHPVAGDDRYGGRRPPAWPSAFAAFLPPGRPFLHAAALGFVHPDSREEMYFTSPLPADLNALLASISASGEPQV